MKIVIPFAQINAHNPNINSRDTFQTRKIYLECIIVAFASLRFWNPEFTLQLTTNSPIEEPYASQLTNLSVDTKLIEYKHNPPMEFGDDFRGCFFLFDAINAENKNVLYLDPDIFCVNSINSDFFYNDRIGAIDLNFSDSKIINGISPCKAREIYNSKSNSKIIGPHRHYGGEAIYIPSSIRDSLISQIRDLWKWNKAASISGEAFLPTEEHILSLIFSNFEIFNLNSTILRIWTTAKYNKVEGGVLNFQEQRLWHLPSEKSFGFGTAYKLLQQEKLFVGGQIDSVRSYWAKVFNINQTLLRRIKRLLIQYNLFRNSFNTTVKQNRRKR